MSHQKLLGKILAALQGGRCFLRANHRNVPQFRVCQEKIVYSLYQRILWAHYQHLYLVGYGGLFNGWKICHAQSQVGSNGGSTSVSGCYKELSGGLRLFEFPSNGMLSPAGAKD